MNLQELELDLYFEDFVGLTVVPRTRTLTFRMICWSAASIGTVCAENNVVDGILDLVGKQSMAGGGAFA